MQKTTNNKTVSLHRLVFLQQGQISELVGHAGFVIELVKLTLQAARWARCVTARWAEMPAAAAVCGVVVDSLVAGRWKAWAAGP